ncbi:MAG TPA: TIGR01777 family oxidoreductase [Draconibacterium sp.]|nr:TIGR01777 family oxidoreductase [Draconibacterium sp.]
MKILITGLNGYLGSLISNELGKQGHQVSGISRSLLYGPVSELSVAIKSADVVINLAGAPILQRWTDKNKDEIYESRIKTITNLVAAINRLKPEDQPKKFISASAIGIYKAGITHNEESTEFDDGFLGMVVGDWEKPLQNLPVGTRKIVFRIGLVIGKNAKTIKKQLLPFKLGLGAKIGSGHQPFPFIHEKDVVQAFVWAVEKYEDNNTFNLVAPENINNKEFTTAFAQQLNRPAFFSIPEFAIKLVLGKASVLLTQSPQVLSGKIQKAGFRFKYPDISSALQEIIG